MSDYNNAWSILNSVSGGDYIGDHLDDLTTDQRLKAAEVLALLSIAQELSAINPQNTSYPHPSSPPPAPQSAHGMDAPPAPGF